MAKTKISEFSATPGNNTDIDGINIAEGCAPSGINDAIRELMAQLKDFQTGAAGDSFNGPVGTSTAAAGAFTTLSASGAVTLSGGTANGVAYLNGSKVLTSGSGLQFDGTNLGLGVTPSAWRTSDKALQIGAVMSLTTDTNVSSDVGYNYFMNSSNLPIYLTSAQASKYQQYQGKHSWFTAPSGTAGNAISFTQAMTLDASGRLGIGTSSPAKRLHIDTTDPTTVSATNLMLEGGPSGYGAGVAFGSRTSAGGTLVEMAKITADGEAAWNTTASTQDAGLRFFTALDGSLGERARIDSSGNLLVGRTSAAYASGERLSVVAASATNGIGVAVTGSGAKGIGVYNGNSSGATSGTMLEFQNSSGSVVGSITSTGSTTSYNTSSDYRLKEDIQPMTGALAKVAALKPVTYKWKVDGSDGEGFIAHELQEVCPQAVTGEKDATRIEQVEVSPAVPATFDEDGNELTPAVEAVYEEREVPVYQGIDTSFLAGLYAAAIKELSAKLAAALERIAALEGASDGAKA